MKLGLLVLAVTMSIGVNSHAACNIGNFENEVQEISNESSLTEETKRDLIKDAKQTRTNEIIGCKSAGYKISDRDIKFATDTLTEAVQELQQDLKLQTATLSSQLQVAELSNEEKELIQQQLQDLEVNLRYQIVMKRLVIRTLNN